MKQSELIYGFHAVDAVMMTQLQLVEHLYLQENRQDERVASLIQRAEDNKVPLSYKSRKQLDNLLGATHHQGIVAECKQLPSYNEADLTALLDAQSEPALLLILDGVQDPHNLGACLRSANAMGVSAVIAPKNRAVNITPTVRKVACGAASLTPFIPVTNLARTMRSLKEQGVWLVGMDASVDTDLAQIDLTGSVAIVLGSEGSGMRRLTRDQCDFLAKIPMPGAMESLNVSVATGVCLYEGVRQRKLEKADA